MLVRDVQRAELFSGLTVGVASHSLFSYFFGHFIVSSDRAGGFFVR